MTKLRQDRWLQVFSDACSAKTSFVAAVLMSTALLPGAGWAASPSHTRHPLPTPLHAVRVTETSSRAGAKSRKGSLKSRTGTETSGTAGKHGTVSRGSGKHGSKARGKHTEPVDDPIPMYRVDRGDSGARGVHGAAHGAMVARGGRHGTFASGPAPLVSSWRHGHGVVQAGGHGHYTAHEPAYTVAVASTRAAAYHAPAPVERRAPSAPYTAERYAATPRYANTPRYSAAAAGSAAQPDVYASGVAHPDDDERMPRVRNGAAGQGGSAMFSANPAPSASVSAAPPLPTSVLPHQPALVQGFGSEIAMPSPDAASPGDRPGGTRRRNHPSNWTPQPTSFNEEPLDEREAITEAAVSPAVLPELYDSSGHLVMRAPLKGSHDVLVHQNMMADNDGLERAQNDADLDRMRAAHLLVSLPASVSLHVNEDLPSNRRMARPWTAMFAADIGHAFYQHFHEPIYITSAVRTVQYQARLQMVNGNAAGLWGDTASPHLTGQAVDMAKRGMSSAELAWMRGYLGPLMQAGKIDVEEEFHQACFHVSVYRSYAAGRHVLQHEVAQVHAGSAPVPTGAVGAPVAIDGQDQP